MFKYLPYGPRGFQMATAGFAGCLALSLLLSTSPVIGETSVYRTLMVFPISQQVWGIFMGIYALAGVVCLFFGGQPKRAAWSTVSILIWSFWGTQILYGGFLAGYVSAIGLFGVTLAAGNFIALLQLAGGRDAVH
jgi:hypothetical protein